MVYVAFSRTLTQHSNEHAVCKGTSIDATFPQLNVLDDLGKPHHKKKRKSSDNVSRGGPPTPRVSQGEILGDPFLISHGGPIPTSLNLRSALHIKSHAGEKIP